MLRRGDRIIYRSIYAKVKRIGEQAGIGKLHPHMLRHTYLTRLYNIEKDLRFVQDQAGYASPTTMPRQTTRPESGRYRHWMRKNFSTKSCNG
ncbi:MAG: phage integrase family protein [Planctomycetes bacterium]|nr:phage integrase family protein [Planctomycetota bacterium]